MVNIEITNLTEVVPLVEDYKFESMSYLDALIEYMKTTDIIIEKQSKGINDVIVDMVCKILGENILITSIWL